MVIWGYELSVGRWGDGEIGRWGDGEYGGKISTFFSYSISLAQLIKLSSLTKSNS
ncbi:MAG: hypothetical protein F6K23_25790 [Okeania sp. SIO2C9]|uniref:hypothetical protein n=1 Tax=Okeania sp. SIO2C9 TaxID=2607791 RepID=UPI0013C218FA|nr:hypothetical protein [Okeania sp. SIO2C9]NEQ76149.1 hypothetical protein [Okeania sp. SIO2C9]